MFTSMIDVFTNLENELHLMIDDLSFACGMELQNEQGYKDACEHTMRGIEIISTYLYA